MRKIPKWVFLDAKTGEVYCERCGKRDKPCLPMPVSAFDYWCRCFGEMHRRCREERHGEKGGQ